MSFKLEAYLAEHISKFEFKRNKHSLYRKKQYPAAQEIEELKLLRELHREAIALAMHITNQNATTNIREHCTKIMTLDRQLQEMQHE